jgi:hypothetical protein
MTGPAAEYMSKIGRGEEKNEDRHRARAAGSTCVPEQAMRFDPRPMK